MIEITYNEETCTLDGFDAMEVAGCVDTGDGCIEVCFDEEEPEFWTVYGHWRSGGVLALWDVPTQEKAIELALQCQTALREAGFLKYNIYGKEVEV